MGDQRLDGRHATVGTIATIESTGQLPSGAPALVVRAHDRALLRTGVAGTGSVLWLQAEAVHPEVTDEARELATELRAGFREQFELMGGRRPTEILRGLDEAAELDGAGWWRRLFGVTLPLLSPSTFFVVVLSLINGFQVFDQVYVMTGGGPNNSSQVVVQQVYDLTFRYGQAGAASALSWMLFFVILVVTLIQFYGQRRWVNYD